MKKSLKSQPPFVQLIILGSITVVLMFVGAILVRPLVLNHYGLTDQDFLNFAYDKKGFVPAMRAMVAGLSVCIFLIPALVFAFSSDSRRPLDFLGFRAPFTPAYLLLALAMIVCSIPLVSWLAEMNQHIRFPSALKELETALRKSERETDELEKHLLSMRSVKEMVLMVFLMGVLPAFVEELFFRSVLQRIFIQSTRRPWAGIIITAIIFSAVHGQFLGFFPRAILGIILGALYWFSGSIWPSILAHFVFNSMQIVLVYVNPKLTETEPSFSFGLLALSGVTLVALLWWMIKKSQTSYAEVFDDDDFVIGTRDQYRN